MSKVSIYENGWTNLVFEGKNKEYGAYQLRKNDSVTTITAFFFGLLFIISISGIAFLLSSFNTKEVIKEKPIVYPDVHLVKFDHNKIEELKKAVAPIEKKKPEIINSKKDLMIDSLHLANIFLFAIYSLKTFNRLFQLRKLLFNYNNFPPKLRNNALYPIKSLFEYSALLQSG